MQILSNKNKNKEIKVIFEIFKSFAGKNSKIWN